MATGFYISRSVVFAIGLMVGLIIDGTSGQDQFALRLANGGGSSHAGRVEVFSDGEWGTVCDRDWTYADAKVVCFHLGFGEPIAALGSAQFGSGTGTIALKNPACDGGVLIELHDCPSTEDTNCDHGDDVGVICSSKSTVQPTPYTARLVDNSSSFTDGRVEVYLNGAWGTICADSWDDTAATLVCNRLGYVYKGTGSATSIAPVGNRAPVIYDLSCTGSETYLWECAMTTIPQACATGDAAVTCTGSVVNQPDDFEVRLVDRPTLTQGQLDPSSYLAGIVEVFVNGAWGRLCNNEVGMHTATVVCRQLGYGRAIATSQATASSQARKIYLSCSPSDYNLQDCSLKDPHICDPGETGDGGIICSGNDQPQLILRLTDGSIYLEGRVEVYAGGKWGKICSNTFDTVDAEVVCRQLGYGEQAFVRTFGIGPEDTVFDYLYCSTGATYLHDCSMTSNGNCNEDDPGAGVACSDVRLVGGDTDMAGTVEVYNDGQWDSVCGDGWDLSDAMVVCRQLGRLAGLGDYRATAYYANARFGPGSGQTSMFGVDCKGTEDFLFSCPHSNVNVTGCPHWKDAGVECTATSTAIQDYAVRLSDGELAYEGRVEFYSGDQWYTVCADGWDTVASQVVCRQLGYSGVSNYDNTLSFGNGTGRPIGGVKCYGEDEDLSDCVISWEGCASSKEAAVECSSTYVYGVLGSVRLLSGSTGTQGRVDVFYDFEWGTICDEDWSDEDATVVCRELGFADYTGKAVKGGYFRPGYNTVFLSNVRCVGNEERLVYCDHDGWRNNDCDHTRDAGVICTLSGPDKPGDDNGGNDGLSAGAIAGICVGSVAVLAGVLIVVGLIVYRKRNSSKSTFNTQPSCPTVYYSTSVVNPPCPIADSSPPRYSAVMEQSSNYPQVPVSDTTYEAPDSAVAV